MQELTRSRKFKNENAESFGKRLRELLDTLLSIGNHANKGYYEEMVIEQYVNNLDFHVSLGVRIAKPDTLEMAIVAARQEEARLALNKPGPSTFYNVYRTKAMSSQILVRRKPNTTRIFTKLRERKIGGSENQRPKYRPSTVHRAAGVSRILIAGAIMLCSRGDVILNPVNNNPGILLLKQGRIMKQIDIFNLACVYNMTYLQSTINELATLFASINTTELYTMHTDQVQNSFRAQIEHNLSLVNRKIDYIIPQNVRRKRGLINGLGSVIKSITGNLDQQDALKFEADILAIKRKVNNSESV
ncbi:uncharacterized protein LOC123712399 [Pieris brassicae]|uniref:uncharacterized protein LOC123712399 n=1 Tax=Pieris brassicae TaxID=7116 RepID=UPI001E66272C|nr:uncharacterized protein LOC123712399 [Pieris brassicae]